MYIYTDSKTYTFLVRNPCEVNKNKKENSVYIFTKQQSNTQIHIVLNGMKVERKVSVNNTVYLSQYLIHCRESILRVLLTSTKRRLKIHKIQM